MSFFKRKKGDRPSHPRANVTWKERWSCNQVDCSSVESYVTASVFYIDRKGQISNY